MFVLPLGTNGFFGSFGRETMCFAIPLGKILIVLDAGSGLFRFAEPEGKKLLEDAEEIHLYLSHYHLDHTFGFYAAFKLFEGKKVKVFAKEGSQHFSEFISTEDFPEKHVSKYPNFSWSMLDEGSIKSSGYRVTVRKQLHNGEGSLAYRFLFPDGKTLAYVTDGEPTEESVEFVKGVDLLLHEHFFLGDEILKKKNSKLTDHSLGGHTTSFGAALIAKEGNVNQLALVHHNPFMGNREIEEMLVKIKDTFLNSQLTWDLKSIEF